MRAEEVRRGNLKQASYPEATIRFSDLVEINPAVACSRLKPDGQVSFIPMSDVTDNGQWIGKQTRMYAEVQNGYSAFREGDVLFAKITPCTENGKGCHAVGLTNGIGFGSTEFHVLRVKPGINARLIYHLSVAKEVRIHAASVMGGSAGQQRVPTDFFKLFRLPPSLLDNQERKADLFDAIDDAIEATRVVIEQTRRLKIVLLQDLLTNGLPSTCPKYQQDSILGKIPMSWVIRPLGQLCISAIDGPFGSNLKTSHYKQSGVRVIRLQNIGIGEFNHNDKAYVSQEHFSTLAQYEAKAGDLLVASMGDDTWPAGRCCEVPEEIQPAMIKADCFRFRIDPRQADRLFVKWYLNSPFARRAIDRGSHGQTRLRLNLANAKRILTPVPPVEEQERIGRIVQVVHDRGVEEIRHLEQLVKLKETLSQGLLTGRIPVGTTGKEVV